MSRYLLSYETGLAFKGSVTYILRIKRIRFFGLYKTEYNQTIYLSRFSSFKAHFDKWDELIKNKTPF